MLLLPGPPPIEITLRRNARARRFSLRVSQANGAVTLSLPTRARESEAMAFASAQESWIRAAMARMPQVVAIGISSIMPFEGRMLLLDGGAGRSVRVYEAAPTIGGGTRTKSR